MKHLLIIALGLGLVYGCNSQKETTSTTTEQRSSPQQGQRQGPPSIDEVFKMDADGNGLLSKSEIEGPLLRDFDKIDSNSDGFISKTELENAPKPERGQRPPRNN